MNYKVSQLIEPVEVLIGRKTDLQAGRPNSEIKQWPMGSLHPPSLPR